MSPVDVREAALGLAASRGFLCAGDVEAIIALVTPLADDPTPIVIDLGAGSGTTALSVFAGKSRGGVRVLTVDHDLNALGWTQAAIQNVGALAWWEGLHHAADVAAGHYIGTPPALLLHDAGHDRAGVDRDLRAWLPLLAPGTPVWVHDYGVADGAAEPGGGRYPGVTRAVNRLVREGLLRDGITHGWSWSGVRA